MDPDGEPVPGSSVAGAELADGVGFVSDVDVAAAVDAAALACVSEALLEPESEGVPMGVGSLGPGVPATDDSFEDAPIAASAAGCASGAVPATALEEGVWAWVEVLSAQSTQSMRAETPERRGIGRECSIYF